MSIFTIKFDDIPVREFKAHEFKSEVRTGSGTYYVVVVRSRGQWFWRTLLVGGISEFNHRTALAHACDVFERATGQRHPSLINPVKVPPVTETYGLKPGELRDFGLPGGRRRTDPPMEATRRKVVPGRRGQIDELEDDDDLSLRVQLSRARNMESESYSPGVTSSHRDVSSSHSSHSDCGSSRSSHSSSSYGCSSSHSSSSSSDSSSSSSDSGSSSSSD